MASATLRFLPFLFTLFIFQLRFSFAGTTHSMESVPDLQKSMYNVVDGDPCVRLLNLSGEIGCANPGRDKVAGPVVRYNSSARLNRPSSVLVSIDEVQTLFDRISTDSSFTQNIVGILIESGADIRNKLKGFSPDQKFPEAEFAPYGSNTYEWNPIGSGIMEKAYDFPVFLLSDDSTQLMREVAMKNEKRGNAYSIDVAEFHLVMQTSKSGTRHSESCLKESTCLPLGGYSVWSSLPPKNSTSSADQSKPVILVVASMDSASFIRDRSIGAESSISGVISLLAAVDSLSRVEGLSDLSKQLVFSVFTGEAWGYLGSRRFLLELDLQSDAVSGLNKTLIEKVIEIGSVGKSFSQGNITFFAHSAVVSSDNNATLNALTVAQESLEAANVTISSASTSNPGIPPSSLMAFLQKNSKTSGIVLEDFDTTFANNFYHSHLDDISNVNSSSISAAAALVARTIYILAKDGNNLTDADLNAIHVNVSLVEELMGCLLNCNPGLSCQLVQSYISPTTTCPNHYVGVFLGEPSSTPYLGNVNDISRFLWNFLADRTSIKKENSTTDCSKGCSDKDEACIKVETDGKGYCVISTTRYVPAYSTRLKYEAGMWNILPPNSSDAMGMVDPVWTESYWDTIGIRVYTVQNTAFDRAVLFGGIALTVLSYFSILLTRTLLAKALKRD